MTLRVLQSYPENQAARDAMQQRGISFWPTRGRQRLIDRLLLRGGMRVGELNKSWDVLKTIELLEKSVSRDDAILDVGAYASEVLCSLHMAGFRNLTGIDLNRSITDMPFNESIHYVVGDMMRVPLETGSVAAITAISVIEHGFALRPLLGEISRLLRPGGLFIGSTDYWPRKIDTHGIRMYGMDWTIFSREEMEALFAAAAEYGLAPLGDLQFDATDPAIECAGKHYTFAWFALAKRA